MAPKAHSGNQLILLPRSGADILPVWECSVLLIVYVLCYTFDRCAHVHIFIACTVDIARIMVSPATGANCIAKPWVIVCPS